MKYIKNPRFKANFVIATYVVILSYVFLNLKDIFKNMGIMIDIVKPFLIAIAIAFVINIPMKFIERKLLKPLKRSENKIIKGLVRPISLTLTIILLVSFITGLFIFIIPQLIESMSTLVHNTPQYIKSFENVVNKTASNNMVNDLINQLLNMWKEILKVVGQLAGTLGTQLLDMTINVASKIANFLIGCILAIYMLLSKEKLLRQCKKLLYAFLDKEKANKTMEIFKISNVKFSKFVAGQCLEAFILGILCLIGMTIIDMPYKILISTVIGVTALIPILGALIGTIPSVFIIAMVSPIKAVWFVVIIIIIQQLEGHFIYPLVVGNSIGLSALWVMFSMIVGGSLFGIVGMLIGIPLFGVIYTVGSEIINRRLKEKNIVKDIE